MSDPATVRQETDMTEQTTQEQPPMTEQATTRDRLILEVVRTRAEGAVQVSLSQVDENGVGMGYRLAGSKHYNMGVTTLLEEDLTERDATEIRKMLDAVFPVETADVDALRARVAELEAAEGVTAPDDAVEKLAAIRALATQWANHPTPTQAPPGIRWQIDDGREILAILDGEAVCDGE